MANLQQFGVTQNGTLNINACPRYVITGRFEDVNPATGLYETVAGGDFVGVNAVDFPAVLKTMTAAQVDALVLKWAPDILAVKAGLFTQ